MRKWIRKGKMPISRWLLILVVLPGLSCRKVEEPESSLRAPEVIRTNTGIMMVLVPEGWFEMGSTDGSSDESPTHKVWIEPFLMDRYEVTQEQYFKLASENPSCFSGPRNPVDTVNWTDAASYCNLRSLAENLRPCYDEETWECNFRANGYRLPTEAEWEYACRAGTNTPYSFGRDARNLSKYGWFKGNSSKKTHPVGQKEPNGWGIYDMHGNVAEWCNDVYAKSYYKESPSRNPRGPEKGDVRVLRGGGWNSGADRCRSSSRTGENFSVVDACITESIGFRCVRTILQDPAPEQAETEENHPQERLKTGFAYDDIYLRHQTGPGHPEKPQRLVAIVQRLKERGLLPELVTLKLSPASQEWLTTVHSPRYVERVRKSCEEGAQYMDSSDTPISAESYEVAVAAVGGVLSAIDAVMEGKVRNAFCAVRPPGHHALKDKAMGFCLFNNVAIAARYIQKKHDLKKVLIVDWDVHHGNGTQEAFYDDPTVVYFSVHQNPFYPGTGSAEEKGRGKGLNYNVNVPLRAGSGDKDFERAFREKLMPAALDFRPDFVLISAGFDAHEDDPLGGMKVTAQGYGQLTRIVKQLAETCSKGRLVSVLEGGYSLEGMAESVEAHLRALME
jgi:acetoin utilization deacetylase AcuC-like enzyme/formylglycine-generating enzyme required for sulfatase activity